MKLRNIEEFCPPGTQISSPGGLSFSVDDISFIEAYDGPSIVAILRIAFKGGSNIFIHFYDCVDGGPPPVFEIKKAIEDARNGNGDSR